MKKYTHILFLLLVALVMSSCSEKTSEATRARRYLNAKIANSAVNAQNYVVNTQRIMLKRGGLIHTTGSTNFFAVHDGVATLQITTNLPISGPNGMGGITIEGPIRDMRTETDSKGVLRQQFMFNGSGVSAQVFLTLNEGSDEATVEIQSSFYSGRITLYGPVVPYDAERLIKGTPLP